MSSREPGPEPFERHLLVLLCAAVLGYWAFQFQPFVLPNNDYHSFERTARSFAFFELPTSFKRMPILPALMAVAAPAIPGPHPYLHAALGWNQVFSIATLVGLFLIGRRTLGRGALLPPLLFATTTQFHANGLQPLVEPSLGCFVVWAFVMQGRGHSLQYVFAAAAALSRYEAAMLIPVLFLAEWSAGRRFGPPFAKAALATLPLLVWTALGAMGGSGGASYYDLMEGMGFQPAPGFFLRSLKEPFAGWYTSQWIWLVPFAGVVLLPFGVGIAAGVREQRRLALSMLGFGLVCVTVIVVFGINKARYVYPTEWIWLLFWAWGALRLAARVAGWAGGAGARVGWALAAAGFVLSGLALAFWIGKMSDEPQTASLGLELGFLAAGLGLAGLGVFRGLANVGPASWRAAAAAGLLLAAVPLVAGGLVGKQRALHKIYYANWSAYLLAGWLGEHLGPDERAVLLPRSHVAHLTALRPRQLVAYAKLESEGLEGLRGELVERGITVVAFTDRGPLRNPSHHYYYREKKTYLAELFESAGPVPGFEHVATLRLPEHLDEKPVQIFRVSDG